MSPLSLWSSITLDSTIFFAVVGNNTRNNNNDNDNSSSSAVTFDPGELCAFESAAAANQGRNVHVLVNASALMVPEYM